MALKTEGARATVLSRILRASARLPYQLDPQCIDVKYEAVVLFDSVDFAEYGERVGRCGSSNQVVISITPLRTKRSQCGVALRR